MKDSIAAAKVWPLLLYFALAASMLGTMARGFGWISPAEQTCYCGFAASRSPTRAPDKMFAMP
jgi:hypothetical protein